MEQKKVEDELEKEQTLNDKDSDVVRDEVKNLLKQVGGIVVPDAKGIIPLDSYIKI